MAQLDWRGGGGVSGLKKVETSKSKVVVLKQTKKVCKMYNGHK